MMAWSMKKELWPNRWTGPVSDGMLIVPLSPSSHSIRPFQPRKPARVTTNAGTPILAKNQPCSAPMAMPVRTARTSDNQAFTPWFTTNTANRVEARPLTEPTDRSISPSSRTKTRPMASMPVADRK